MSQAEYFKHVTGTVLETCHKYSTLNMLQYSTLNMSQVHYFKHVTGRVL